MKLSRYVRWVAAGLVASLLVVGCGSQATPQPAGSQTGATQPSKKFVVGVALASATEPFYVAMRQGIETKAKELGNVELRFVQAEEDPVKQLTGIQNLVTQKVDAILVSPIDNQAEIPGYEAARAAHIPVFSIARSLDPQYQVAFIGADWTKYGRLIAEQFVKALGGKGNIAMIEGPAGASFVQEMTRGFKEVIAQHPGMKIVAEGNDDNLTEDVAARLAADFLTAHPDIQGIYGNTDELALGAAKVVEERGLTGKVFISGFDGTPNVLQAIKDGKVQYTIALKPYSWGGKGLQAVVDYLQGKQVPALVEIDSLPISKDNINSITPKDIQ